ncbi:Iron-sulfur assembly protein 1 [Apophysomyces ossiformis]|uniref:Iron-sulfur assembly protein 1 n=1 Tax=Apophysomyces ossiformis TaxID=679940 RepID=A0A8H7BZP1_9FUNG|nr:Iron-sulfur assembly protein 1 [Apophysomyces ossiformis]
MSIGAVVKQAAANTSRAANAGSRLRLRKAALTLTPAAVIRLKHLTSGPTPQYLRVGVKQKGCSGNSYMLEFTDTKGRFDEVVNQDGVTVLVDSKALITVLGSEMDYVEDKLSSHFVFHNPNAKGVCGCGESFAV